MTFIAPPRARRQTAAPAAQSPASALGMSIGGRLALVAPVLVALWAGVYWALT